MSDQDDTVNSSVLSLTELQNMRKEIALTSPELIELTYN